MAERASKGRATATVQATIFIRRDRERRPTGHILVGRRDGWRWDVVAQPGGVCQLVVSETPAGIRIALRLAGRLQGPRGCSEPLALAVQRGRVVPR
jgi:hypothetical protein